MEPINKFQKGKIYMLWSVLGDQKYYGSTVQTLGQRMSGHRNDYKTKKRICSSFKLFDLYGVKNCQIELVLEYPCNSKSELDRKEGEYIRANACVNRCVAGQTDKEYKLEHKDKINEYQKKYDLTHKEQKKEYTLKHKDEINKKARDKYHAKRLAKIIE